MQFSGIGSLCLYFGTYALSAFCLDRCAKLQDRHGKRILYILSMFLVVLLATIRYDVGSDYITYTQIYDILGETSFGDWFANMGFSSDPPAVFIFVKIARLFGSAHIFFMLFAIAIYVPGSLVILRHKDSASVFLMSFAFLMTTFTTGLNIMKQTAACAIILYSLQFILDRKPVRFIVAVICAVCFHPTALIVAPLCLLCGELEEGQIPRWRLAVCGACYLTVCLTYRTFLSLLGGRFESYIEPTVQSNNYSIILSLLQLFILLWFRRFLLENDKRTQFYLFLLGVGVLFEALGFTSPFVKRISLCFSTVSVLLLPQLEVAFAEEDRYIFKPLLSLYYMALFFVTYYLLGQSGIIPFAVR